MRSKWIRLSRWVVGNTREPSRKDYLARALEDERVAEEGA